MFLWLFMHILYMGSETYTRPRITPFWGRLVGQYPAGWRKMPMLIGWEAASPGAH